VNIIEFRQITDIKLLHAINKSYNAFYPFLHTSLQASYFSWYRNLLRN